MTCASCSSSSSSLSKNGSSLTAMERLQMHVAVLVKRSSPHGSQQLQRGETAYPGVP